MNFRSEPLIDPTDAESVCIDGYLVIGANRRGEICLIYQYGKLSTKPEMVGDRSSPNASSNLHFIGD